MKITKTSTETITYELDEKAIEEAIRFWVAKGRNLDLNYITVKIGDGDWPVKAFATYKKETKR